MGAQILKGWPAWPVVAGSLLAAVIVGRATHAIGLQVNRPDVAVAISPAPTGRAQANLAYAQTLANLAGPTRAAPPASAISTAVAGYRAEPLATSAIAAMALATTDRDQAVQLLRQAGRFTRRLSAVNAALFDLEGREGRVAASLAWLDRGSRISTDAADPYVRALVDATAAPGVVDAMVGLMGERPSWADRYWSAVPGSRAALVPAASVRGRLAAEPWLQRAVTESDQKLLDALLRAGEADAAGALARQLAPAAVGSTDSVLADPGLTLRGMMPPFGWRLASTSEYSGVSLPGGGVELSVGPQMGGVVLEQLVELPPGRYRVELAAPDLPDNPPRRFLEARLTCFADRNVRQTAPLSVVGVGLFHGELGVVAGRCRWLMFQIAANNISGPEDLSLTVSSVRLKRVD